ncbi:hypothetical protein [Planctomycetes bacterium K23_9]|uniref:Uncharacterized protein n=1 Tax=Stieleria marina TaxID=1930275 RepID=A0A517P2Q1_9BACT|nr:hypothetical protein K239x_56670 [Planctomycetes bacterium K23_9]
MIATTQTASIQITLGNFVARPMPRFLGVLVLLCASAFGDGAFWIVNAQANPSTAHPERPLSAHGTIPGAKELAKRLYEVYRKHESAAIDLDTRTDNPSRLPYRKLSQAGAELYLEKREAKRLRLMGEPAAVELERLLQLVNKEMHRLMGTYRGTTAGAAQVQKNLAQLNRIRPRNDKALDKIADAIKNNQLEQAEKQLEKMGSDLEELLFIMIPSQRKPHEQKFLTVRGQLDAKLTPLRRQQYAEQAKLAVAANLQQAGDFLTESRRVAAEMAANGKVTAADQDELDAPGAVRYLAEQWGQASAALIRSMAIQWAFSNASPSQFHETTMPRVSQLTTAAKEAITGVIDAAAVSTSAEAIPALYSDLLLELSYIDRRMVGSGVSKDCAPAMQRLASKASGFPAQIAAYQRAVEQPLKWRSRFARLSAESLDQGYLNAAAAISQEFNVTQFSQPKIFRPGNPGKRVLMTSTFVPSSGWKVADLKPFVIGLRVSENDTLRLYEGSLTALVKFDGRHYSNIAVGMPLQREWDDLKISLMINDDHPPLSIEAADAMSSAQARDFVRVGGAIRQVHLEAAVTRFINLPGRANQLAKLGGLPILADDMPAIEQACWRLDIEPHWVQHRYFTVAIPSKLPKAK